MKKIKLLLLMAIFILMPVFVNAEELTDEQLWESFIEKYKTTELVTSAVEGSFDITSTNDSLNIVVQDGTESFSFSFTYEDGILTYVPSTIKTENYDNPEILFENLSKLTSEDLFVMNSLLALANLKEYDQSVFDSTIDISSAEGIITLEEDGIEITDVEYNEEYVEETTSSSFTFSTITSYKLDLRNGLNIESIKKKVDSINAGTDVTPDEPTDNDSSTEDQTPTISGDDKVAKEEVVENPDTGKFTQYGIVVSIIIGLGVLGYFSIRKHSKFPQV